MASEAQGLIYVPVWVDAGVIKALVDDNGRIPVQLGASGITLDVNLESSDITLNTEEQSPLTSIQAQGYGYDGSAWKKQGMIWAYKDTYNEYVSDLSTVAGTVTLQGTAVPAGEVWVITGLTAVGYSASMNQLAVGFISAVGTFFADNVLNPINGQLYPVKVDFRLNVGDYVFVNFYNLTATDGIHLYMWGYKMKVDM